MNEDNAEKSSSSEEKAQEVEKSYEGLILKELPKHLKYVFLGAKRSKSVIIEAYLTKEEAQKLIGILRKYKEAIAWSWYLVFARELLNYRKGDAGNGIFL